MNREESIKFLALVKVAYPTAYKDMDKESKLATVNMWQCTFYNVPLKIMELAIDHFRRVSKFPPTVADMYEELRNLYYRAIGDENIAYQNNDKELMKMTDWIIAHTGQFRGGHAPSEVSYNMITAEDLKILPSAETPKLIGREDYD